VTKESKKFNYRTRRGEEGQATERVGNWPEKKERNLDPVVRMSVKRKRKV